MITKITCCHHCVPPKRYPGCSDHCKEYQEQRKKREEEKAKIKESKSFDSFLYEEKARCAKSKKGGRFINSMGCK